LSVAESLWDNPEFIQADYHIGRYVTASVNTEAKRERIKALYSSMKTTSELVDVSIHILPYLFDLIFDSSLMQAIVKHSQDRDQFLKVSIKRMQETQTFEDELKEATELNLILSTQNQELVAKLTEESRLKDGNFSMPFILNLRLCLSTFWTNHILALGMILGAPDSATNAFANLKAELDKEKAARFEAQIEVDVLTRVVKDLTISVDRYATQIPTLKDKINHLEGKVVDGLKEV
jgi:hypothetical protein